MSRAIVGELLEGELLEVLAREFARDREELARVAVFVDGIAEVVEPGVSVTVLADEADNRILECALDGGAELVVTGDKEMLALGDHEGVRIVRSREDLASP